MELCQLSSCFAESPEVDSEWYPWKHFFEVIGKALLILRRMQDAIDVVKISSLLILVSYWAQKRFNTSSEIASLRVKRESLVKSDCCPF